MSTVRTNTLSNAAGSASVPVDTVISGSAKAWVNFNGTGTVAIRAAFNVSSITDNGTGDYTVNFTTAMSDANYASVITIGRAAGGVAAFATIGGTKTASVVRIQVFTYQAVAFDSEYTDVSIFR